jgi:hypothetical protein
MTGSLLHWIGEQPAGGTQNPLEGLFLAFAIWLLATSPTMSWNEIYGHLHCEGIIQQSLAEQRAVSEKSIQFLPKRVCLISTNFERRVYKAQKYHLRNLIRWSKPQQFASGRDIRACWSKNLLLNPPNRLRRKVVDAAKVWSWLRFNYQTAIKRGYWIYG